MDLTVEVLADRIGVVLKNAGQATEVYLTPGIGDGAAQHHLVICAEYTLYLRFYGQCLTYGQNVDASQISLQALKAIPAIDEDEHASQALSSLRSYVDNGELHVFIFPHDWRNHQDRLLELKIGLSPDFFDQLRQSTPLVFSIQSRVWQMPESISWMERVTRWIPRKLRLVTAG